MKFTDLVNEAIADRQRSKDGNQTWGMLSGNQRYEALTIMKKKKMIKSSLSDREAYNFYYVVKKGKVADVMHKQIKDVKFESQEEESALNEGTEIAQFDGAGVEGTSYLDVKQFASKNGKMLQLTVGMKYIQINPKDAERLGKVLTKWGKSNKS